MKYGLLAAVFTLRLKDKAVWLANTNSKDMPVGVAMHVARVPEQTSNYLCPLI